MSLVGCDLGSTVSAPQVGKAGNGEARRAVERSEPGRPMRGTFKAFEPVWFVTHVLERLCSATLVAGAEAHSSGNITHLGRTEVSVSAAWDWAAPATRNYAPEGPTTNSSATILGTYPYDFCSSTNVATGQVVLEAANGDEVHGVVTGGEVYELGYDAAGDGQEQFLEVQIVGGTGRFESATGAFVIHSIAKLDRSFASSDILAGGNIRY